MSEAASPGTHTPRIIASWLVPGIPLAYGLFNTLKAAVQLFS